jgi:hypothetical protein
MTKLEALSGFCHCLVLYYKAPLFSLGAVVYMLRFVLKISLPAFSCP